MGIGDPAGLLEVIERGVDLFDCVLPTRIARMGTAFTSEGRLNLRNAGHARSRGAPGRRLRLLRRAPASPRGACATSCMQKEILGMQLLTEHNLRLPLPLVDGAREAIVAGRFAAFKGRMECLVVTYPLGIEAGGPGAGRPDKEDGLSNNLPCSSSVCGRLHRHLLLPGDPAAAEATAGPRQPGHLGEEGRPDRHRRRHVRHGQARRGRQRHRRDRQGRRDPARPAGDRRDRLDWTRQPPNRRPRSPATQGHAPAAEAGSSVDATTDEDATS